MPSQLVHHAPSSLDLDSGKRHGAKTMFHWRLASSVQRLRLRMALVFMLGALIR